jgi:class 3 adenylate cyclase
VHRDRDALGRTRTPGGAPAPAARAPALKLQRAIGNRAVGQVLARTPAARKPRQTGLRRDEAIARYARKAVMFWQRNPDLALHHFASFLGAAVNTELNLIGIPDVGVKVSASGAGSAAALFDAENWMMLINPDTFTHRGDEVQTMGDLTEDEAAIIAMTVYHEARHGEQHFRIARLQYGEGKELGFAMGEEAAAAAAADPLRARGGDPLELREARDWYSVELGEDATYREAVTSWQGDIVKMARLARDVKPEDTADLRERIGRLLRAWSKSGGAEEYVRGHLASAQKRGRTTIVADITQISRTFSAAEAAWKRLGEDASPADFKPLSKALGELYRAVNKAYENAPVEFDAYRTGDAVFDAFHAALKAARAQKKKTGAPAP